MASSIAPAIHVGWGATSPTADSNDIARAYDLGANSYLVKPLAFEGLLELLRTGGLYWMVMTMSPTVSS